MFFENFFGVVAFVTSVIGLFPQVAKAIKTRSTQDISMLMLVNYLVCSLAWVLYSIFVFSIYVLASNVIGLLSSVVLIYLKRKYDRSHVVNPQLIPQTSL